MSTSKADGNAPNKPPEASTVVLLLRDIGDTTWRMFIPIVGLTLLGVWVDKSLDSKPLGMIIGIGIGCIIAGILIRAQLKKLH